MIETHRLKNIVIFIQTLLYCYWFFFLFFFFWICKNWNCNLIMWRCNMFFSIAWEKGHIGNYWKSFSKKILKELCKLKVASAWFWNQFIHKVSHEHKRNEVQSYSHKFNSSCASGRTSFQRAIIRHNRRYFSMLFYGGNLIYILYMCVICVCCNHYFFIKDCCIL